MQGKRPVRAEWCIREMQLESSQSEMKEENQVISVSFLKKQRAALVFLAKLSSGLHLLKSNQ